MTVRDAALAALTSVIWGLAFVAVKFALQTFSAPELTAVRFLLACLPVFAVRRPGVSWRMPVLIGLTLFTDSSCCCSTRIHADCRRGSRR